MSETYMITAKTVEEAIAIANREYADEEHEVSYEIIDMPKKGFLGIGARDAKIKITVSKIVSADLSSIVADLRNLKVYTDRDSGERREKQNRQKDAPQKNAPQKSAAQKNAGQAQNSVTQKPATQKPVTQKPVTQKPVTQKPKADAPEKKNPAPQPKKPAEAKPAVQKDAQQKPKQVPASQISASQVPASQKPASRKTDEVSLKQVSDKQVPASKAPAKQIPAQQAPEAKSASPAEAKVEAINTVDTVEVKEYRSSLGNEVKGRSRRAQPKRTPAENEIKASGVEVKPIGLTDFTSAGKNDGSFGSAGSYTSGKMSNDIKKKPKSTASTSVAATPTTMNPAKANMDALKALQATPPKSSAPAQPKENAAKDERRNQQRKPKSDRANKAVTLPAVEKKPVVAEEIVSVSEEAVIEVPAAPISNVRDGVTQAEMDYALEFANTLLANMKINASAVPASPEEGEEFNITGDADVYPKINIIGDDTGVLIGHHGETLDAIQYLVNLSALRRSKQKDGDYVKIVVDIEGYREKREETLRSLARRKAAAAVKYKRNIFLEPMNAYERRIIHSELQSFENVSTHSVGADRDRKIIITYEGPDKQVREKKPRKPRVQVEASQAEDAAVSEDAADTAVKQSGEELRREQRQRAKQNRIPIEQLPDYLESREAEHGEGSADTEIPDASEAVSEE